MSIFNQARDLLKNLQSKATGVVQNNFQVRPGSFTYNALIPAAKAQQFIQSPPQFTFSQNIKNPVARFGAGIAEGVLNQPGRSLQAAGRIGTDIRQGTMTPQRFIGNTAEAAMLPLSFIGGSGVVGGIGSQILKPTLKQAVKTGATQGAKYGAGFGFLSGLSQNAEAPNILTQIIRSTPQTLVGGVFGGIMGGAAGGLANLPKATIVSIVRALRPKASAKEVSIITDNYLRDKATGRFIKDAPQWAGEISKRDQKLLDQGKWPTKSIPKINAEIDAYLQSGFVQIPKLGNKTSTTNPKLSYTKQQSPRPLNTEATRSTMNQTISSSSTADYIKELTQNQQQAGSSGKVGLKQKTGNFLTDVKAKLVDETAPLTDILTSSEKQYKFKTLPSQDIRLQIDRVLRSKNLASQFAEDNGLVSAIKTAPDIKVLDQYMIAKQAASVEKQGIKTGRDLIRDQQLIQDLSPQYEQLAQQVNQYSRKLLDYSVQTGLIDKKLASDLVKKYPEYVPLNRVFNELEKGTVRGTGKGVASISKQTVVQKLKGSEREITSPIESLLLKTQDAFSQGERNIAAKQLASYKDLPGFEGLIKEVDAGSKAPHTFSYIENGVKKTFATTKEIEAAAKSLNVEQMGLLGKILSTPTRALQLGATGLNIPFVVTNLFKDELTGFINANRAAKVSILNPANYVKSLFSALKHDELYKDLIRSAGGGTSFDIARDAPNLAVAKIRNPIGYTVRHPLELLRAVENIVGRSEEFGRVKNFAGTRQALLKEGRTIQDATLLAAQAARENTANFARRGSFGRVINWMIPFFNAGIQGARQLTRSFQNAPVQTSAKVTTAIFTPIAVATAWNLSDPKTKQIYQDIPQYEKENNIIIIPPNTTQDAKGRWTVIKIPLPPGLSNLGTIVRRSMETAEGLDPIRFAEIVTNLITAGTSVDVTSGNKLASTFTPQLVKPVVEATTNTNLFTGQQIVPEYMKNRLPEAQTKPGVSGVATGIGKILNVSPLMVENTAQTALGGLGSQLLGKESAIGNLQRRFSKASGGDLLDKVYNDSTQVQSINSQAKKLIEAGRKEEALQLIKDNKEILMQANTVKALRSEVDKLQEAKNKVKADSRLTQEQKDKVLILIQKKLNALSVGYSNFQNQ